MSLNFELSLAFRYLKGRNSNFFCSVVTLFSILGITIGVAALIVVISVMNGFSEKLLENILGINGHITVHFDGNTEPEYEKTIEKIMMIDGVTEAAAMTENQAMIKKNNTSVAGVLIRGLDIADIKNRKIINDNIVHGTLENFEQGIAIGQRLAENLHVQCGDKITIISPEGFSTILGITPRIKSYKIIAIFNIGIYEYDNIMIYMPLKKAQLFFNYGNNISGIEVFIANASHSQNIMHIISKNTRLYVEDWQIQQGHYFDALKTERNVMFFILTLIILVAMFNIISNLFILVETKKKAIAIMRTIGATSNSIMRVFCFCGVIIGIIGTFLGCIIGISISLNINNIKSLLETFTNNTLFNPIIYFFETLPSVLLIEDVIKISSLSLTLSFLATILPARKAAKQNPVDILRYE